MNDTDKGTRVRYQALNYENGVILPLIRDICINRRCDPKSYQVDIETLAMMLPKDLRKEAFNFFKDKTLCDDLSKEAKKEFDDYLVYQLELLETNGIAFPRTTYDIGHD